jgi:serine/threonine-protein kinase
MVELGDYLVHRLIGEGGMGKVYEAEERLSKRRVALKVLHPELARSDDGRRLFLNEMQILAQLEHPNIVRSLASTEVGGELVMVLEFLDGKTLRAVLSESERMPWAEAARITSSVAAALSAAHGREPPVIHRDLKPENIMVLGDGTVKVMDFGIAKVIQAMGQTNTQSVGTLQYMSPEQIDAQSIDQRSDLYCLGLVFYECLAGKPPFVSASPRQLLNLQCTAEPPALAEELRSGLPKGVEDLVFQLLEKAPEDRPYLAADVVERLEPFLPARPRGGATRPAGPSNPGGRAQPSGVEARTPRNPTPRASRPSGSEAAPATPVRVTPARAAANDRDVTARSPGAEPVRADTIALLERVDRGRSEVPTKWAIAIIVALSLLAGIGAYILRATGASRDPSPGPTANAPEENER